MSNQVIGLSRPEEILKRIGIRDNAQAADFGCGNGYFSVPLAKIVNQGKVYAVDVVKETLEAVKSKADLEGISNIETIHCNLEVLGSSKLDAHSMDFVLMRNILFQSQKKEEIIKEARRVLKEGGQLVIIEWIASSTLAPKGGWLISQEEARQLAENEGLLFEKELEIDSQHYGLVFRG
ncbi:class I SAM-dependent methyltransferase [Patescibacteria group bacterium]|nr:class I SAM-dependent methyltransferase [Patescibacteria group bacterium]MBU4082518.1 class I SAM-dependent methyltransferase [Patescibacteria group bacterium]